MCYNSYRLRALLRALILLFIVSVVLLNTGSYSYSDDTTDQSGFPTWDVNQDAVVDAADILTVTRHLGKTTDIPVEPNPDVNRDGKVDILDLILVSNHYGENYQGNPYVRIARPEARAIPQYGKFEARIETNIQYSNPFSLEEVDLNVYFLTPSGIEHTMPAFYDEEDDQPVWKVRYAPMEVGSYRYYVVLGGTEKTAEHMFDCVSSDSDGFIRVSPDDYRYFQFDSGKPYFAIGHNVCWTRDYEHYFKRMAEHGENFTRIWMIHWNVALEWSGGDYPGLGRYHLEKANWIDRILDLAEQHGIYIMLCLESFNTLRIRPSHPAYEGNPYAKENGGMLEKPEEFFTNTEARRLFKQRLRYLVARYTYSPNVLCWEFWNEVDIVERYVSEEAVAWHQEMARHLRQIDPMKHLISTSFANTRGDDAMWQLPEMEITQNHQYGDKDIAESVRRWTQRNVSEFHKPHIFGEFGADSSGPRPERDPDGISLHNGIWAAVLSGSAGTAMLWWWDNYIDPNDLYYHFQPLAQFVEGTDWPRAGLRDADVETVGYVSSPGSIVMDLELPCTVDWVSLPVYQILHDATVKGESQIPRLLYPPGEPKHREQTFFVDYPEDGTFEVHVDTVLDYGRLQVLIDRKLALDQELPTGPGNGPWRENYFVEITQGNRIPNSDFEDDEVGTYPAGWTLEDGTGRNAMYYCEVDDEAYSGRRSLKIIGVEATGTDWHAKIRYDNMSMEAGKKFTIAFWAKVDANEGESREVSTSVQMQHEPWTFYRGNTILLDSIEWKEYFDTFTATADVAGDMWVGLAIAQSDVDFWMDNFRFLEGEPSDIVADRLYSAVYDRSYSVHVPAGKHTILVDNQGKGWLSVDFYRLSNYLRPHEEPPLRVFGLQNDTEAMLWLQNSEHTWHRMSTQPSLRPIIPVLLEVRGMQDGKYRVEWWDTYQPNSVESAEAVSTNGVLQLETPEITRDIACKVRLRTY